MASSTTQRIETVSDKEMEGESLKRAARYDQLQVAAGLVRPGRSTEDFVMPSDDKFEDSQLLSASLEDDDVDDLVDIAVDDDEAHAIETESVDFSDLETYFDNFDQQYSGDYEKLQEVQRQRSSALRDVPTGDFLSRYMLETNRQRLLTAEEEVELARQIEQGRFATEQLDEGHVSDPAEREQLEQFRDQAEAARTMLVRSNTRLVISIAKRYFGQGLDFLDLIQEGNIGLLTAVDKFDYTRGTRFSTYATWWIRQGITRALSNYGRMIRIPAHQTSNVRKLYRAIRDSEQNQGHTPEPEELARIVELPVTQVRWLLQITRPLLALEQPAGDDQDAELADFIEDRDAEQPADAVSTSMFREKMGEILGELSPREAAILRLRYGLQGYEPHTLKEVGEVFDLSRERIRQVEKTALSKLRRSRSLGEFKYMLN